MLNLRPLIFGGCLGQSASDGWEPYLQAVLMGAGLTARKFFLLFCILFLENGNLCSTTPVSTCTVPYTACKSACRAVVFRDIGNFLNNERVACEQRARMANSPKWDPPSWGVLKYVEIERIAVDRLFRVPLHILSQKKMFPSRYAMTLTRCGLLCSSPCCLSLKRSLAA